LNTTWIAQELFAANVPPHLLSVIVKRAASTPPRAALRAPEGDPPELVRLNVMTALGEFTAVENVPGLGARLRVAGLTTVVFTGKVRTSAPEEHTILAVFCPGVVDLKVKANTQGVFAGMIAGQVVFVGSAVSSAPLGRHDTAKADVVVVTDAVMGTLVFTSTGLGTVPGTTLNVPGVLPVPDKETVRPVPIVSVPLTPPTEGGAKLTEILQVADGTLQVVPTITKPGL
jgi:hypothetical protein